MSGQTSYSISSKPKFDFLELIDVPALAAACQEEWTNQTLCRINDSVIRLAVVKGEFHWHKHDQEDEFFFVLQGELLIDLEEETVTLKPHQGFAVPKGKLHRTRAPERTVVLVVEQDTVEPTGD